MISTGNLHVDYAIKYTVQSLYTLISIAILHFNKFLIDYPDIASVVLIVIGAIISYYLIKNLFRIVYSVIITTIKLLVILTLVFFSLWVYVRGVNMFTSDLKAIVDYTSNFNPDDGAEQVQKYGRDAQAAWGVFSQWAAHQVKE